MDPLYESYFADRVAEVRRIGSRANFPVARVSIPTRRAFNMVSDAIPNAEVAARANGSPLRGDAQLLLLLAFQELVARPVAVVRPDLVVELSAAIDADMLTIAQSAAQRSEGQEVSAHAIVDATSGAWSQLRTSSWNLWDR